MQQQVERIVEVYGQVIAHRQPLPKLDFGVLLYDADTPMEYGYPRDVFPPDGDRGKVEETIVSLSR